MALPALPDLHLRTLRKQQQQAHERELVARRGMAMRQRADAIVREQSQRDEANGEAAFERAARPFFHAVVYAEELSLKPGPGGGGLPDIGFNWTVLVHYLNGTAERIMYRISPGASRVYDVARRSVANHERAVLAMQARAFRAEGTQ